MQRAEMASPLPASVTRSDSRCRSDRPRLRCIASRKQLVATPAARNIPAHTWSAAWRSASRLSQRRNPPRPTCSGPSPASPASARRSTPPSPRTERDGVGASGPRTSPRTNRRTSRTVAVATTAVRQPKPGRGQGPCVGCSVAGLQVVGGSVVILDRPGDSARRRSGPGHGGVIICSGGEHLRTPSPASDNPSSIAPRCKNRAKARCRAPSPTRRPAGAGDFRGNYFAAPRNQTSFSNRQT